MPLLILYSHASSLPVHHALMQKFVLVEHSLQNLGGHYYTYAYSVLGAAEAAGYQPILAANRAFRDRRALPEHWQVHTLFGAKSHWTIPGLNTRGWRARFDNFLLARRRRGLSRGFAAALAELFGKVMLAADDHVFVASASDADLLGLAMFLAAEPSSRSVTWHVQFHHPLFNGREPDFAAQADARGAARAAFKEALGRIPHHRLRLYCTTPQLARQYQHLDVGRFMALPYAIHALFRGPSEPQPQGHLRPTRVACLGHTRMEKGYDQLPQVIRALWSKYLSTGRGELLLQTRRRKLRHRLAALVRELGARSDSQGIAYAPFPLDLLQYAQLVRSVDVNLLLYDSTRYYARCSGVLLESLVAGVPVIVPAGGWLADQIDEPNQRHLDAIAQQENESVLVVSALQFSGNPAVIPLAASHEAVQVMIEFRWQAPLGYGTYARLTLQQRTSTGQVEFAAVVRGREHGPTRVLFNLAGQRESLQLRWENAYGGDRIEVTDVRIAAIAGIRHPLAGLGLTAAQPQQAPALVEEILEHLEHYRRAAQTLCTTYADYYSARSVVAICTADTLDQPTLRTHDGG